MIFLSDLNHDLNQRFKSNDLNHNNPDNKPFTKGQLQYVCRLILVFMSEKTLT